MTKVNFIVVLVSVALGLVAVSLEFERQRITACAIRQITSLIKICEANDIPLAQDIRTSEWCEGPKAMSQAEFEEFREGWTRHLETGISPMSGRPISLDDPINGPTVALIAGLKVGRFVNGTIWHRAFPAEQQQP